MPESEAIYCRDTINTLNKHLNAYIGVKSDMQSYFVIVNLSYYKMAEYYVLDTLAEACVFITALKLH